MRKYLFLLLVLVFSFLGSISLQAQSFGQNKVVVSDFRWQVVETSHFYVHYYDKTEPAVKDVARILENGYERITRNLNIEPMRKIPFFLYASHNDFEQTNISTVGEGVGGFTELYKNRFVVPVTGSQELLTHVIEHELTHALVFEFFFGGYFWRSIYLFKSLFYPLWLLEGLSEYESAPYDPQEEMILRDAVINNHLVPLDKLSSFDHLQSNQIRLAYNEGHSALHYVREKYGQNKVVDILYMLKDSYDVSAVLNSTLRKDIFKFNKEWEAYLKEIYGKQVENKKDISEYGKKITSLGYANQRGKFSPDGKRIIFLTDRRKRYEFYTARPDGSQQKPLWGWWHRQKYEWINMSGNVFSFSPDGKEIVFAAEKLQKEYIYIYHLERKTLRRINVGLDEISSPNFSPDGTKIIFSGLKNSFTDIYVVDRNGKNLQQITHDEYDDTYPVYLPDGKNIIYVSERIVKQDFVRSLYSLALETGEAKRLSTDEHEEYAPVVLDKGETILYIASGEGIYNVYRLNRQSGQRQKLTDVKTGVVYADVSFDQKSLLLTGYRDVTTNLYLGSYSPQAVAEAPAEKPLDSVPDTIGVLYSVSPGIDTVRGLAADVSASTSTLILRQYPYKLKATTDYFLPLFIVYAGTEGAGAMGAFYWQISDMLGNHNLGTGLTYSSADSLLDYQVTYGYGRFRPQFFVTTAGTTGYALNERNELLRVRDYVQNLSVVYPFDRFHRVEAGVADVDEYIRNRDLFDLSQHNRLNLLFLAFSRDFTTGELFDINSGHRFYTSAALGRNLFGGEIIYNTYRMDVQKYWTYWRRNIILAANMTGINSNGRDFQTFQIGNRNFLRGFSSADSINGRVLALGNAETRFYLFRNINYHLWFMIPDLYFKSLQAVVFTDNGVAAKDWEDFTDKAGRVSDVKNSVGAGLRLNSFILQRFAIILRLDYAKRTDQADNGVWYFNLGASF